MSPGRAPATRADPGRNGPDHQPDDAQGPVPAPEGGRAEEGSSLDPIPLPEVRWNSRSRRRRKELARRRRRRLGRGALVLAVAAVVTGLVATLAAPVGRLVGREQERPAQVPAAGPPAGAPAPAPLPVLLAHQDPAGRASSLTVLVPAGDGKGGTLVLVPSGTMTEVVSLGLEPVGQSLELGGPARLRATVENLLGTPLGGVVVVDDAGMGNLLAPAGPIPVTVPDRVERVGPNGRVEVLYEAGPTTMAPSAAARFLSAKGRENDLGRLARHQAFWEAWLGRLRERPTAVPSGPPELKAAAGALAAGSVKTRLVPVEAFGSAADGGEMYKVRAEELARLVTDAFPDSARQEPAARPRVQVLNGTGALELADAVRAKLGAGFDVRLTGNAASFDYQGTEVVYYDRDQEEVADRVRRALGVGTLVLSRRPLDVVDVTVIVGKDFHT